jgi:hypothetical protein
MEPTSAAKTPQQLTWTPSIVSHQIPGLDLWQNAVSAMTVWNSRALSSVSSLNKDWLEFINHRLEEDAVHLKQLSACKSAEDWWRATSSFLEATNHDYQDHYAHLAKISSELAGAAVPTADMRDAGSNDPRYGARKH